MYQNLDCQALLQAQMAQMQMMAQQQFQYQLQRAQQSQFSQAYHGQLTRALDFCGDIQNVEAGKKLNRDEFIASSLEETTLRRQLASYSADGIITAEERAQLQMARQQLQANLKSYRNGDHQPTFQGSPREAALLGRLYDMVQSGKITPEEAKNLRLHLSLAAQQQGVGQDEQASENLEQAEFLLDMKA